MTADQIQAAVHAYVHRTDALTVENEPNALALSWAAISRTFFPRESWQIVTLPVSAGAASVPALFGQALSVSVTGKGALRYVSQQEFAELLAGSATGGVFTITGTQVLVDGAVTDLVLSYAAKLEQPAGNGSNWLTEFYPDVWTHAAIAEQWRFVQDYEASQAEADHWQGLASKAMLASERQAQSGGGIRMRGR